ncbi:MAG: hypothetical protein ACXWPI_12405 [Ktedonobacterales bacterium]
MADKPNKPKRTKFVLDVDAEPHNADWIRILEHQRTAKKKPQRKEQKGKEQKGKEQKEKGS